MSACMKMGVSENLGYLRVPLKGYYKGTMRVPLKGLYKGLEFPKIRGTLFGVLIIRILLFRGTI